MSLSIFEDMFAKGLAITESKSEIGFQRNNVFVDIGDLGVTARRAVDAAFFVVAQEKGIHTLYDVELSYFRWLMRYDSANYKHLRSVLTEAQKAVVQVTDTPVGAVPSESDRWISVHLIGTVAIANGRIVFDVPTVLQRHIKDPVNSHWLSLRVTTAFTLLYARAIYDHVLPFVSDGVTEWFSVDAIRAWPGKSAASTAAFKYFKRDSLEPAVRQICEKSDIEISYETRTATPSSKKIEFIRFRLSRKGDAPPVVQALMGAKELYTTLKNEFGLSDKHFDEILANREIWTDEWINQAIEFTRFNLQRGKVTKSPAGFLMKALRDNLRVSSAEKLIADQLAQREAMAAAAISAKAEAEKTKADALAKSGARVAAKLAEEVRAGHEAFVLLESMNDREDLLLEFSKSLPAGIIAKRLKLDLSGLTYEVLTEIEPLHAAFGQFMFGKAKAAAAVARR
ncbi:replication initiation protein [Aromatoleum sp.]|uniref:replication initiation protein n=1 Tax=Aromatoleum sp. TaxID=2307007 RepID=UPI002B4A3F88|nr:replication initiation protein [Aromatoleum sp.]